MKIRKIKTFMVRSHYYKIVNIVMYCIYISQNQRKFDNAIYMLDSTKKLLKLSLFYCKLAFLEKKQKKNS